MLQNLHCEKENIYPAAFLAAAGPMEEYLLKSDNAGENDEKKFFHRLQINDHETEKNNICIKK